MRGVGGVWLSVVLVFAAIAAPISGRADPPLRLTIDEAVAHALAANPDVNISRKDYAIAETSLQRSKAWFPSNPYLQGGAQRTTAQGVGPNYTFFLSQEVEVGGQRQKRIAAANEGVTKASWDLKSTQQSLAATVKAAFIQALLHAERVSVAHDGVTAAAELSRELDRTKQHADGQRLELNVAAIQETRARRDLAAAEQHRDTALATLRRLLGLPLTAEVELVGAPERTGRDLPPAQELVERALHQRADLAALRHAVQHAELQLALLKREAIPNVIVSGTVSHFEGDTLAGGDLGVPLPIFHSKAADISQAVAERAQASLQLESLERTVAQEVTDARRACVVAGADLEALQNDIVPKSEENLRLERRLYERGDVTVAELVGIEVDLLTARRDQLDALQSYNEALIELQRVTGATLDGAGKP